MKRFGLDFGTTNSSLSMAENGQAQVMPIDSAAVDPRVVRSMLYFARREMVIDQKVAKSRRIAQVFNQGEIRYIGEQEFKVGQSAVEQYLEDNTNRTAGVKRIIKTGRLIDTRTLAVVQGGSFAVEEHYEEMDYGTGRLLQALKSSLRTAYRGTSVFGKFYTVEELISIFIRQLKDSAEAEIGQPIESIKVGRPVHFSDEEYIDRRAQDCLQKALEMAGFAQVEFEFEPVAAAKQYIYSLGQTISEQMVFVFDFGGGTLDTALVKMGDKPEVLATDGIYIGGDLLNADIMQSKLWDYFGASSTWGDDKLAMPIHFYEALNSWYSIPNLNNPDTMHSLQETLTYKHSDPDSLKRLVHLIQVNLGFELYEAIEKAKKELSTTQESRIIFKDGPIDINIPITRVEFEAIIQKRVEAIEKVVHRTLTSAGVKPEEVTNVVRTGGSSLIPIFEQMLQKTFGAEKITLFETFTSIAGGLSL